MNKYFKKVNKRSNKEMFEFLKNHFTYYTMNSWNGLKSIANNVKVYNLGLNGDEFKALEILEADEYFTINNIIEGWEYEHPSYEVGFNGRSAGYLVITEKGSNQNILEDYITDVDNYTDFKEYLKERGWTLKEYHNNLIEQVELVQAFDSLCDELVSQVQYMLDNYTVEEETQVAKKVKVLKEI